MIGIQNQIFISQNWFYIATNTYQQHT